MPIILKDNRKHNSSNAAIMLAYVHDCFGSYNVFIQNKSHLVKWTYNNTNTV